MASVVYMKLCRGISKLFVAFNSQPRRILLPVMVESQAINQLSVCLFYSVFSDVTRP